MPIGGAISQGVEFPPPNTENNLNQSNLLTTILSFVVINFLLLAIICYFELRRFYRIRLSLTNFVEVISLEEVTPLIA